MTREGEQEVGMDTVKADGEGPRLRHVDATASSDRAPLPRLLLWKRDVAAMLGVGVRTLERMISAGEIPAPDRRLRGRPAWLARTIHEWAEKDSVPAPSIRP
jgi:predicted DNA-binding transcriptional regulator AlpA